MNAISGIYAIINTVNGKRYIGSTINFKQRTRQHFKLLRKNKHHSCHLQSSFNKYGEVAFVTSLLEHVSPELLIDAEQRYLDTNIGGYNIAQCAEAPARGRRASPETRAKLSATHKGFRLSPEHKAKLVASNRNRYISPEMKVRLGNGNRGRRLSPEWRAKISASLSAPEVREKMSAAHRGRRLSIEHRAKIGDASRGRIKSPEERAKLSSAKKAYWERIRREREQGMYQL